MNDINLDSIEATRQRVAAQVAEAQARKENIDHLADQIENATETARSPRGEVAVVAAPSGRVLSVTLGESAASIAPADLSKLITSTIAQAQRAAAMVAVRLSSDALGEASPLVEQLEREAEAAFPGPATDQITFR
ncbi:MULTISPECIES: YbaB/EbfC family nucleoid-associated protein [unclassified Leucobacter]|uniref:YbaB/EbfC family nucleoid-associated protein n=1 Tax=unclassified Leucobacter TaxID=2621730 RepID=UPI00165E9627|nr:MULTISPECIES: YbaB/EbfC family nucleoid-associated protein [unclassified Leucobacter]MBC9927491.1 YbaB/EbfC family nucleoid-associated protein [Leucobacter sp. cx-169]